jgi:hypothetical protein
MFKYFFLSFLTGLLLIGCSNQIQDPESNTASVNKVTVYTTQLSGLSEVPPNESDAWGTAILRYDDKNDVLHYRIIVHNLIGVTQAHIHIGSPEQNGPVVAFLYGPAAADDYNGVLASGTITEANLIGPLVTSPLSALIDEFNNSNAYINVHTVMIPAGEIRGNISSRFTE